MNIYAFKQEVHKLWRQIPGSKTELLKKQCFILIVSFLLSALLFILGNEEQFLISGNRIQREPIGGMEKKIPLRVSGLNEKESEEISVTVSPRLYSKAEADKVFSEYHQKMESLILSETDSFDAILGNLQLKKVFSADNIRASWSFQPESLFIDNIEYPIESMDKNYIKYRDILEESGLIHHDYLENNQVLSGKLELVLSTNIIPEEEGEEEELSSFFNKNNELSYSSPNYFYYLRILPSNLSEREYLQKALENSLHYVNEHNRSEDQLFLPKEICGHTLHFSEKKDYRYLFIPILGILFCLLLPLQALEKQKNKDKLRAASLTLDYSELVSKLVVYLGAGLAIRNSFAEIAKHYNYLVQNAYQEPHPLYEELNTLLNQLSSNVGEGEAYLAFAGRIALRPYGKLISLIEQNRKNGSKDLARQLHMEMEDAFSVRKHMAKRLGEEAGTKLLIPLILQLFVIMLMILYPAMQSLN